MTELMSFNKKLPNDYVNILSGSLSENTKLAYMADIQDFFGVSLSDVTIDMIKSVNTATAIQYRDRLLAEGKAPSTINRKLTSLSKLYTFLCRHEIGIMQYNPFSDKEGLARLKYDRKYSNTRCLTEQEVKNLVKVTMEGNSLEAVRNRIIILLLATTGMRRSELCSIKLAHIGRSQDKNIIEILGKGNKQRLVVISNSIKIFIDNYIAMRDLTYNDKTAYLFVSHSTRGKETNRTTPLNDKTVYNVVKNVAERAGIGADDISPHCLRHTFITESLNIGVKLEDIQDMVGHADMGTTRRYDHTNRVLKNNPADMLTEKFLRN